MPHYNRCQFSVRHNDACWSMSLLKSPHRSNKRHCQLQNSTGKPCRISSARYWGCGESSGEEISLGQMKQEMGYDWHKMANWFKSNRIQFNVRQTTPLRTRPLSILCVRVCVAINQTLLNAKCRFQNRRIDKRKGIANNRIQPANPAEFQVQSIGSGDAHIIQSRYCVTDRRDKRY